MLRQAVARSAMDCHSSSVESVVSERTDGDRHFFIFFFNSGGHFEQFSCVLTLYLQKMYIGSLIKQQSTKLICDDIKQHILH